MTKSCEATAARLAAATALLLQFSPNSFNPENDFYGKLVSALDANREHFEQLPGRSEDILIAIIDGRGADLAARNGNVDASIDKALHSEENEKFVMQKAFSVIEADLLKHPQSILYLQQVVDAMIEEIDKGFSDEEAVSDLSRDAHFMGPFGLLLVLPECRVDPSKFLQWKQQFTDIWDNVEPTEDENEIVFEDRYNAYLELAFECGIKRYSKE